MPKAFHLPLALSLVLAAVPDVITDVKDALGVAEKSTTRR